MALVPYTDASHPEHSQLDLDLTEAWLISDTHFRHRRIPEYEPIRTTLGADHNDVMVARWQEAVADDDLVVHLGDLYLGKTQDFAGLAGELPGRKKLVKGNHDRRGKAWYARHGFQVIRPFWLDHRGWMVRFQHYPDYDRELVRYPRTLVVHGHVHSQTLDDPRHLNVSVEAQDFRPRKLIELVDAKLDQLGA